MFETVSGALSNVLKKLSGNARLTEANVSSATKEIKRSLLDADVDYAVVKKFVQSTKQKVLGSEVTRGVSPYQMFIKVLHDELVTLMGTESVGLNLGKKTPSIIMVAGLQGAGKTTFAVKLAHHLKKKGKSPLLVACDVYRPAAIEQLKILAEKVDIPVYSSESKDVVKISMESLEFAGKETKDVVIVDTAGRLQVDEKMMNEAENLKNHLDPSEILFVVDGMIGQEAVKTAKVFNERLDFDGVVVTKMDGDTRGGVALSVKAVLGKPIKFISQGEKVEELDIFYPSRIADRILGMGDIVSFVEKVEETLDKEKLQKMNQKLLDQSFTINDFLEQIQEVKKLGSLKNVMEMVPGFGGSAADVDEKDLTRVEAVICSMTKEERLKPSVINGSRRMRIAKGSGTNIQEVNKLLKQFNNARKLMRNVSKKRGIGAQREMMKTMLNQKN